MKLIKEKYLHGAFVFAVAVKVFTGLVESVGGALLLAQNPLVFHHTLDRITRGELTEVPSDYFFNLVNHGLRHLTVANHDFVGLYLLGHGFTNLFIAYGLSWNKPAAYLVASGILIAFIFYQVTRVIIHPSWLLGVMTGFDLVFVGLVYNEYNYLTKKLKNNF